MGRGMLCSAADCIAARMSPACPMVRKHAPTKSSSHRWISMPVQAVSQGWNSYPQGAQQEAHEVLVQAAVDGLLLKSSELGERMEAGLRLWGVELGANGGWGAV